MITGIRVGHYRQIGAQETIELVHPERDGQAAEPACATGVWGAHGAGKSALIDALEWLHNATVRWAPAAWPPTPRSATARPATVGVELLHDGTRYRYSLSAEDGAIVHEKLYAPGDGNGGEKRDEIVFERTAGGLELGDALRRQPEMALLGRIGPTGTVMLGADLLCEPLCASLKCQLEAMRFVRPLGRIDEALQATVDICSKEGAGDSPAGVRRRIAAALLQQAGIDVGERDRCTQVAERIADAGDGARRAAAIAGAAAEALADGRLLAIDPIDAGVHVVWQKTLVGCFTRQPKTRTRRGQLLFTAASSDLIDTMPRDQVWFAEPGTHGTTVGSLADFDEDDVHVANTRRRYETGRYGAIPEPSPVGLQRACRDTFADTGE